MSRPQHRLALACGLAAMTSLAAPARAQVTFAATHLPHAEDRDFERLPDLRVVRGARLPLKKIAVSADAGVTWSSAVSYADPLGPAGWIQVAPASGTGPATVALLIDAAPLTGDGPYRASVTFTPDTGEAATVEVNLSIWPPADPNPTRDALADPANWPTDSGFQSAWELWGFLPSALSHAKEAEADPEVGANLDAWERTPCPEGGPYTAACTRPGQAGLSSGMAADAAWRLSTGDPRVTVAVLDSGIRWHERELLTQYRLNARELKACPPPGAEVGDLDSFDVNGDGRFNMRDYDGSAYADVNGNGFLDPQDLIRGEAPGTGLACSDGVDDDVNGYVDDICGWDFFWNDNDPSDDSDFGHGTGEAKDSVGEADNGMESVGGCPRCTLLPVRVGDSFVVDANNFAEGVVFAVDSGAKVVQEALGSINSTTFMQAAIDLAYRSGVTVVASAADEASYHHNYPGNAEHTLYVHAIVYDNDGEGRNSWKRSSTFLNFNNCTNFGGHLALSTPGSGCSSEATGKTSGQAALLHSFFLQERERSDDPYFTADLSTEESYQLMTQSAEDIDVPTDDHLPEVEGQICEENADCRPPWYHCFEVLDPDDPLKIKTVGYCRSTKYPSGPGWDEHFGFGRNNARRSLELIRDKRIPPEVDLSSPRWFEVVNPRTTSRLDIRGSVGSARYARVDWTLEWAPGIAPAEAAFTQLASGQVTATSPLRDAALGQLDTTRIFPDAAAIAEHRDQFTVTLRLTATADTSAGVARGVARKTFAVHADPDLKPGWPLYLGAGVGAPAITDLDGDGRRDLVMVSEDGKLHAFNPDTSELPGFPVSVNPLASLDPAVCQAKPRACHADSAAYASDQLDAGAIHSSVHAAVAIGDLDGDGVGRNAVVATLDGLVFAFSAEGQVLEGFPVTLDPAHTAEFEWGLLQPTEQRFAEFGVFSAPVLGDLDADGDLEIVAAAMDQWVYAWHHDGGEVNGWPVHCYNESYPAGTDSGERLDGRIISTPVLADLDGDGMPEVAVGTNERVDGSTNAFLYAIWPDGNAHPGGAFPPAWPQKITGFVPDEILPYIGRGLPNSPAAADVDHDGVDEVVISGLGGIPTVLGLDGRDPDMAWMFTISEYYGPDSRTDEIITLPLISDPTIADLDLNGRLDLVNGTAGTGLIRVANEGGRRASYDHSVSAWDLETGYFLQGYPQKVTDFQFFMNYAVADISGDGFPELIFGDGGYFVYAFDHRGRQPKGWPKFTSQWNLTPPAVGDLDGDGLLEVAAGSREGWLYLWETTGPSEAAAGSKAPAVQWARAHHDDHNSGNYGTPLGYKIGQPTEDQGCGCTCAQAARPGRQGALLVMLTVVGLIYRRSRLG